MGLVCANGCGENTIISSFTPAGLVRACSNCGLRVATVDRATALQTPAQQEPAAPLVVSRTQPRAQPVEKPVKTQSILQQARARVAELEREIKRLERLRAERDELKRLLAASKKPSVESGAVVRALRKQG